MTQQKVQSVSEALFRAKEEEQDVFLCSISKEELERTGFDASVFGFFEFVNIYLQWDGEYQIKYEFDGDPRQTYYVHQNELGENEFMQLVEEYLNLGGGRK